jgi:hypothetical protein
MGWRVMRQDDNGNVYVVRERLSEAEARALADELERRGHKQTYWVEPMPVATGDADGDRR